MLNKINYSTPNLLVMPRIPRFLFDQCTYSCCQREIIREPIFIDESDFHSYLEWLVICREALRILY